MRVFVLGSGSSGNAILVEAAGRRIFVDAGVGPRACERRLGWLGAACAIDRVDGIVATHHHGDHFGQVERLARATGAPVWVHAGIDAARLARAFEVRVYTPGRPFRQGPFEILAESVPHDAPQVALRVEAAGIALGVATDVGRVTPGLEALLGSCDGAIVESNHCATMLWDGKYPEHLKHRVSGGLGHLSNGQTAALAARLVGSRLRRLWLGHLSRTNNTAERALATVAPAARGIDVAVLDHGTPVMFDLEAGHDRRRPPGVQLALF